MPQLDELTNACARHLPAALRWGGAVARQLRRYDVGIGGKTSGSSMTDALTLADLCVQELIVAALRDCDPVFQECRLEAEEGTGDIGRFAPESPYTIAIDPIDGTKTYRDHSGDGWAVIVMLRSAETVHFSLVYIPETGPNGMWVEANGDRVVCGEDDWGRPATDVLRSLSPVPLAGRPKSKNVYVIGFQDKDRATADAVTAAGLRGFTADDMPGSIFELQARGEFAGSLIHTPNVYDFPVSLQIARALGGDALWVHNRRPVHFEELWLDERADMLRLPGIAACSEHRDVLETLCEVAKDWSPQRYR
ncbi:MAG: inositol monophosphatase family protein [Planctomycetaceae bacterium]